MGRTRPYNRPLTHRRAHTWIFFALVIARKTCRSRRLKALNPKAEKAQKNLSSQRVPNPLAKPTQLPSLLGIFLCEG